MYCNRQTIRSLVLVPLKKILTPFFLSRHKLIQNKNKIKWFLIDSIKTLN